MKHTYCWELGFSVIDRLRPTAVVLRQLITCYLGSALCVTEYQSSVLLQYQIKCVLNRELPNMKHLNLKMLGTLIFDVIFIIDRVCPDLN